MVGRTREFASLRRPSIACSTITPATCSQCSVSPEWASERLIAAFVDALDGRAMILSGRCLPYGEGIAFIRSQKP